MSDTPVVAAPTNPTAPSKAPVVDPKVVADSKVTAPAKVDPPAPVTKVKIGEKEYTEAEILARLEKAEGADKKFLESSKQRKEAQKLFKFAKEHPEEFLEKLGIDPKKWSYDKVAKDLQDKMRDPKEVELEQAKKRLEEFEKKEAEAKAADQEKRQAAQAKAYQEKFEADIIAALESTPTLPKNADTVATIAKYLLKVFEKTGVMLSAKDVVQTVHSDFLSTVKAVLAGAKPEQIEALLGPELMSALRKYDIAKVKDPLKTGTNPAPDKSGTEPKKKFKNSHEFWKTIDAAAKAERGGN